jgi:hypothetical protein
VNREWKSCEIKYVLKEVHNVFRGVNLVMYMSISNVYVWKGYK